MAAERDETVTPRPARFGGERLLLAILLVANVGLRLLWRWWLPMPPESDYATFLDMATKIAAGNWSARDYGWVYQGAGYPLLLAGPLWFGVGPGGLLLLNVVLQTLMILVIWRLGRHVFGVTAGLVAAGIVAFLPGIWPFVTLLAAENATFLLLPLLAYGLARLPAGWPGLGVGLVAAALGLTRPAFLPFVLVAAVAVLVGSGRLSPRRLGWYLAGVALVMLPVVGLNLGAGAPPLPVGAMGWQVWLVNNERATGAWFDAAAADDYPFHGIVDDDEARAAQLKLGLQYVVANPFAAASGAVDRFTANWARDSTGIDWTWARAPAAWQARVPLGAHLATVANVAYLTLLGLALVSAVRSRGALARLWPVLLPLAYGAAVLSLAEANARYHTMLLPLLAVMAGGAFGAVPAGWPRQRAILAALGGTSVLLLGSAVLEAASWQPLRDRLPGLLLIATIAVPVIGTLWAQAGPGLARLAAWRGAHPRRSAAVAVLILAVVVSAGTVAWGRAARTLAEIAAVAPEGWSRYEVLPDGTRQTLPVLLAPGPATGERAVSFPAAAIIAQDESTPGAVFGLARTLTGFTPGETYIVLLQVYDPGSGDDVDEAPRVLINDRLVWLPWAGVRTEPGWRYARFDWVADADTALIEVQFTTPDDPAAINAEPPRVRGLHLLPLY